MSSMSSDVNVRSSWQIQLEKVTRWAAFLLTAAITIMVIFNLSWGVTVTAQDTTIVVPWLSVLWVVWAGAFSAALDAIGVKSAIALGVVGLVMVVAIVVAAAIFGMPFLAWQTT